MTANPTADTEKDASPEVIAARFILAMRERSAIITTEEEIFLGQLAPYLATEQWGDDQYRLFARVFRDYAACLEIMGSRAKKIGFTVSMSARALRDPELVVNTGVIAHLLHTIKTLVD